MPRLRSARTPEQAAAVPADQPVQIELEELIASDVIDPAPPKVEEPKEPKEPKTFRRASDIKLKPAVLAGEEEQPEVPVAPKEDIATLKAQVDALQKAEKANQEAMASERKRAEDAIRRQNELQSQSDKHQEETLQAQYDSIINGLETCKAEAEAAQQMLEQADLNGDSKGKADAYRRLARAEANSAKLEDNKIAYEARFQAIKDNPKPAQQSPQSDPLERMLATMPQPVQVWIRAHPEYVTNPRLNTKMQAVHYDALDEAGTFGTQAYIESMERHL